MLEGLLELTFISFKADDDFVVKSETRGS